MINLLSTFIWAMVGIAVVGGLTVIFMFIAEYFGWDNRIKKWLSKYKG